MARNTRKRAGHMAETPDENGRACDWPGCKEEGSYRAPRSPRDLRTYRWFCLAHVRAYNLSWNYYAGMNEDEVEHDIRRDTVWHRPTWRLGTNGFPRNFDPGNICDGLGSFNASGPGHRPSAGHGDEAHANPGEEHALAVLDLRPPIDPETVKARYKQLVKRHHPDANGGDKASEEKFKQISQAYATIMSSLAS
jgi:hypothetical protein